VSSADFLFGGLPMAVVAFAVIGTLFRLFTDPIPLDSHPKAAAGTWATLSTRWGLAIVAAVYVVAMARPEWILGWNSSPLRLYLFEGFMLAVFAWALVGVLLHLVHFASDEDRSAISIGDVVVTLALVLFLTAAILAMLADRWATSWSAGIAAPWLHSLFGNDPRPELMGSLPVLARVHTLALFGVIAGFPFSRFMMWLAIPARAVHRLITGLVTPTGESGWGQSWVRAFAIFLYFTVFTVILPNQVVNRLGGASDFLRDAITGGVWLGALGVGLIGLRWLQKTSRI